MLAAHSPRSLDAEKLDQLQGQGFAGASIPIPIGRPRRMMTRHDLLQFSFSRRRLAGGYHIALVLDKTMAAPMVTYY
jgi:hypothetical protein